jgi:hypothetical protein
MLDDSPVVIESEYVYSGIFMITGPLLVTMQDDKIALGDGAPEVHLLARVFGRHPLKVRDERVRPVGDLRVVLDIRGTYESFDGLARLAFIEHQVVKSHRGLFVRGRVGRHSYSSLVSVGNMPFRGKGAQIRQTLMAMTGFRGAAAALSNQPTVHE